MDTDLSSANPIDRLAEQMRDMMKEFMGQHFFRSCSSDAWEPALNIYELPHRWVICVELAGVRPEDTELFVADRVLHVRGLRPKPQLPESPQEVSVHVMEIDSGRFHRRVALPDTVDASRIDATFRQGYLWISLPVNARAEENRR